MAKVKLSSNLYDRIKSAAELTGYSSPDEFVIHIIEKELETIEATDANEDVQDRLRGLGYID